MAYKRSLPIAAAWHTADAKRGGVPLLANLQSQCERSPRPISVFPKSAGTVSARGSSRATEASGHPSAMIPAMHGQMSQFLALCPSRRTDLLECGAGWPAAYLDSRKNDTGYR